MKVLRLPVDSSVLVTVDEVEAANLVRNPSGLFVRLKPTATATDEQVKTLKKALLDGGAVAVRVMPKPPSDKLQLSQSAALVQSAMVQDAVPPVRDLVAMLVDSSTSKDKVALKQLLNDLADQEGL